MTKPNIPNLTVICVAGNKHGESIASLYKAQKHIDAARFVLLTNQEVSATGIEVINVGGLDSWAEYNRFCVKELTKYFDTDYCLLVQWDGVVLDGSMWSEDFLSFDYIGASWLDSEVGNGGFSIRSKKLQDILAHDDFISITEPEDVAICRLYKGYLQKKYGVKYATKDIADRFAFELNPPIQKTFGKHGFHHREFKEHIIIKRSHAMGDIVLTEPIIDYYAKRDYQVVLDVPLDEMRLFIQYPYFLLHISQLDPRIKPFKVVDLNMSYEINPKRRVLESYYEMAGIKDGELRNSRLYTSIGKKFFDNYILIHVDDTSMPHRNSHSVDWNFVVNYYKRQGYEVFQVGLNPLVKIAPHINCPTKDFLMYLIKGANLVIGLDSGICQLAVALDIPAIILAGSVDMKLRYVNFDKIRVVQGKCPQKEHEHCYHKECSTTGVECRFDKELPPCSIHDQFKIIEHANKLLKI